MDYGPVIDIHTNFQRGLVADSDQQYSAQFKFTGARSTKEEPKKQK